jgi:hypothetical protein
VVAMIEKPEQAGIFLMDEKIAELKGCKMINFDEVEIQ